MTDTADTRGNQHYLKRELYDLVRSDPAIFEFLQAGSLDGIWFWDLEHPEHEWMSARFWEVFGYSPSDKQHLASEWQDMIHPDDLQVALDNYHKHCADPAHRYDQIVRYRHKDGSTVWVRCRGLAIRDEHGRPVRMLGAHNEVTVLKRAEEELLRLNEELQQRAVELQTLNEELKAFTYSVSHDLRAPLRSIDGFSQALLDDCSDMLDEQGKDYLRRVRAGSHRMGQLIDDLLKLSRITRADMERRTVDLSVLARSIMGELQAAEPARRVEIDVASEMPAEGDPQFLLIVLQNLIENAWKFTSKQPGAKIEIGVTERDGKRTYFIRDNGAGFDMTHAHKLFGAFQRLHSDAEFSGSGIGLATVHRIISRHGGGIWAESEIGRGATFYFTL